MIEEFEKILIDFPDLGSLSLEQKTEKKKGVSYNSRLYWTCLVFCFNNKIF